MEKTFTGGSNHEIRECFLLQKFSAKRYLYTLETTLIFSLATFFAGLLNTVGLDALCYIVLLLMPVLGRMSDQQQEVRYMASRCFAVLVSYMPLEVRCSIATCSIEDDA